MKILVIRFSSIGDIVLASPVLRCVKKQIPGVTLHFLTRFSFRIVTAQNPYVDQFFYYRDNMAELLVKLRAEHYDYVLDLQNNIRSKRIVRSLDSPAFTIDKLSAQKFLLTQLNIDVMPDRHISLRSLDTAAPLGVKDDGEGLDYFIAKADEVKEGDIPTSHLAGYIALVIGANHFTKRLPVHKLRQLCASLAHPVILLGGKDDFANGCVVSADDPVKIYNACGKFNISESADLLRKSKLVISNDTGMLYIACAFKRPVIAVWGGTSPDLDVEPYYGSSFIAHFENFRLHLRCQPCSRYGLAKCPLEHFHCMEYLDMTLLADKIKARLNKAT